MRKDNFKKQSYFRLWRYVRPYRTMLFIGIVAGIMTGGFFGASFFWLKGFVQPFVKKPAPIVKNIKNAKDKEVFSHKIKLPKNSNIIKDKQLDSIITIAAYFGIHLTDKNGNMTFIGLIIFITSFIMVWGFKNLAVYVNGYCMKWVGTKVITDMRSEIFDKLLNQSLIFYSKTEVGQLISRCVSDTSQIQDGVSNNIADLTSCPFQILACVGFIIFVSITNGSYVILIVLGIAAVLVLFPIILIGKKVRTIYAQAQQSIADVISRMHEVFTGIVQVKAYNTERMELEKFNKINNRYCNNLIKGAKAALIISPTTQFLGIVCMSGFFFMLLLKEYLWQT